MFVLNCFRRIVMFATFTLLVIVQGHASGLIPFLESPASWDVVKQTAQKEKKLIFLDAYTDWCSWCKVMDKETFSDSTVAELMNKHFVPVRYEMETGFGITLAMKYRVSGFPTFLVFSPEGKLIYRIVGFQKPDAFIANLKNALDPTKHLNLTGISANMEPGFPVFLRDSYLKRTDRKNPDSTVIHQYMASVADLTSESAWSVLSRFSFMLDTKYSAYVLNNAEKYSALYGSDDIEGFANSIVKKKLSLAIVEKNPAGVEEAATLAEKFLPKGPNFKDVMFMQYYQATQQWPKAAELFDASMKTEKPDPMSVNNFAWGVFESCDDAAIIRKAAGWMKPIVIAEPIYMYLDTYAALLFKSGDLAGAKKFAEQAIAVATAGKEDCKSTEEMLKNINNQLGKK